MAAESGKHRSSGRPWTPEEEGLLVAHMDRGGQWVGWRKLLPDRSPRAIHEHRHKLGLTNAHLAPSPRWTPEQRDALIHAMRALCEEVGHDPYEVMAETHRLLARAARRRIGVE